MKSIPHLNTVRLGDCIEAMASLPAGCVDLAFADPPFNIGYEYDVYQDKKEHQHYLDWSRRWITAVHRVLNPSGTFWLAIGDDYAAELKLASQEIGFHARSWVIWYYTFGVNCKHKFSRSHVHLFYFVKDRKNFTFRSEELENRIPSARQLVYGDCAPTPTAACPTTPGCCVRRTWPIASQPRKTLGTSRAWRARSKSEPVFTAARCPSSSWAGSSALARKRASWWSIRSAAAPPPWRWPRSWAGAFWRSICRRNMWRVAIRVWSRSPLAIRSTARRNPR